MVLIQRLLIALCLSFLPISMSQLVMKWGSDKRPVCDCVSDRPTACGSQIQPGCLSYMVTILVRKQTYSPCDGSLITERHVLSPAHCFYGKPASEFTCVVNEMDVVRYRQIIEVQRIRIHRSFQYSSNRNDIAILELAQAARMRGGLKTAVIPNKGYNLSPGASLTSLGWRQSFGYSYSKRRPQLQTVEMKVSDPKTCEGAIKSGKIQQNKFDSKSQICASGGKKQDRSVCLRSSLGLVRRKTRFDIMIGLSVGRQEMCYPQYNPAFYTLVSNYGQWIYSLTKNAKCAFCVSKDLPT